MVHRTRVRELNRAAVARGRYVLYWMQASQRTRFNHALEFAVERADAAKLPLIVCFGLMDNYPEANERHYAFLLEGLSDVEANLRARGIRFVVRHGMPADVAVHYAAQAAEVVCDRGYTRHQKRWRDEVADRAPCRVTEVETDAVVPVELVSQKHEFAARTIRPKIHRLWHGFLVPLKSSNPRRDSLDEKIKGDIDVTKVDETLARLRLDRSLRRIGAFVGGEQEAARRLKHFIHHLLKGYAEGRNEPAAGQSSTLSPYLHFGNISPVEMALAVRDSGIGSPADRDSFLEELIVRRELSLNFVNFNPKYDSYDCLPAWARQTLARHSSDRRPVVYSRDQLESAATHDPYWNAAQREMVTTGFMHNYMRMYWGKKILEWSPTPEQAFATTLAMNNKYFFDGRDPNSFANVGWIFGLHDRPWTERPIFGTVRYMNAAGLERKFDIKAYVRKVEGLREPGLFG
jgi:deoxyribodipyrimidine photo-lyase